MYWTPLSFDQERDLRPPQHRIAPAKCESRGEDPKPGDVGVLFGDTHTPLHDAEAVAVLCAAIVDLRPAYLLDLGDFMDCESMTSHERPPGYPAINPKEEIRVAQAVREKIDRAAERAKTRRKLAFEGNHEWRYMRWLMQQSDKVRPFLPPSLPAALGLEENGWEWIPNMRQTYRVGRLFLHHGHWYPVHHASKHAIELGVDNCYGHTHRPQQFSNRTLTGGVHTATGLPCLRDPDAPWQHMRRREFHGWATGFAVVTWDKNLRGHVHNVLVQDGQAAYGGHVWRAR
jgi:hypothetical protein